MRTFLRISNLHWGHATTGGEVAGTNNVAPLIFELLPRAQWGIVARARWYLSLRYWKQAVAAVTIYSGVLMTWAYLVR